MDNVDVSSLLCLNDNIPFFRHCNIIFTRMQPILTQDIEVWDTMHKPITVHIGENSILWHEKSNNLCYYSCRGEIKGYCLLTDIVFCHYRHKVEEVVVIALPRKRSHRKARALHSAFFVFQSVKVHYYIRYVSKSCLFHLQAPSSSDYE